MHTNGAHSEPRPTRKERERLARRQLIVDAALAVFSQRGFHATRLDEVAERAEFAKATLYSYFETKEALFQAVIEEVFEELLARGARAFAGEGPFRQKLDGYIAGETRDFFEHPEGQYLLMAESHHLRGDNPLLTIGPRYTAMLERAIADEQRRGGIRSDLDAYALAIVLRSLVYAHLLGRIGTLLGHGELHAGQPAEEQLGKLNERIRAADIGHEVALATTFITAVFLTGVGG